MIMLHTFRPIAKDPVFQMRSILEIWARLMSKDHDDDDTQDYHGKNLKRNEENVFSVFRFSIEGVT